MQTAAQNQIKLDQPSTRIVWRGSAANSFQAWKKWKELPEWAIATDECDGEIVLAVANEYIDWPHYRSSKGEYRPIAAFTTTGQIRDIQRGID